MAKKIKNIFSYNEVEDKKKGGPPVGAVNSPTDPHIWEAYKALGRENEYPKIKDEKEYKKIINSIKTQSSNIKSDEDSLIK